MVAHAGPAAALMAVVLSPQKNVVSPKRRGPQPVGGPEDGNDGSFHDGAEVHGAGVVGDQNFRLFQNGRQLKERRLSGEIPAGDFPVGTLKSVGKISFALPETSEAVKGVLFCELDSPNGKAENHWDYWIYPECTPAEVPANVKIVSALSEELIDFIADGNRVLLTDNFPADCTREKFGLTTTGRNMGHHGIILHKHPVLKKMANEGFADWNFYNMLNFAKAMDFYNSTLPFAPVIEYVPSYKLVTYKTPLCELRIGKGILMMCGVRFETSDCGGTFFKNGLLSYLANADSTPLPEVSAENMKNLLHKNFADAGMVKTDEAWDPNVSGGKKKR